MEPELAISATKTAPTNRVTCCGYRLNKVLLTVHAFLLQKITVRAVVPRDLRIAPRSKA